MSGNGLFLLPKLTTWSWIGIIMAFLSYVQLDRLQGASLFEYDI
jgi:hypothetical protein